MPRRVPIRRPHKKSRLGCQECKRRHVKCDEARLACAHCVTLSKTCVYRSPPLRTTRASSVPTTLRRSSPKSRPSDGGARSATTRPSPASVDLETSTPSNLGPSFAASTSSPASLAQYGALDPPLNIRHMQLFSHLIFNVFPTLSHASQPNWDHLRVTMPGTLSVPYVVYQVLALSALHMSHTNAAQADYHRQEATALHTQALALFNEARPEVTAGTCVPMLIFSSFLGLYTLAEAVMDSKSGGDSFLERFIMYLNLHRGVRVPTGQAWDLLVQSDISSVLNRAERALDAAHSPQSQQQATIVADRLDNLLDGAGMSAESEAACRDAASRLVVAYRSDFMAESTPRDEQSADVLWAWPVHLSGSFTKLLMERRPEALIILCYFAVLLHRRRHMWLIGDAGRGLIQEMTRFLGTYWKEYLDWPNQMLQGS